MFVCAFDRDINMHMQTYSSPLNFDLMLANSLLIRLTSCSLLLPAIVSTYCITTMAQVNDNKTNMAQVNHSNTNMNSN